MLTRQNFPGNFFCFLNNTPKRQRLYTFQTAVVPLLSCEEEPLRTYKIHIHMYDMIHTRYKKNTRYILLLYHIYEYTSVVYSCINNIQINTHIYVLRIT